ncbi:MAG: L-fucose isomerase [Chloroflexi bacterium]|nr:L-fucose isomerase [Chloroflexota bacterium]
MAQVQGMKRSDPVNRLRTPLPKIGIRPTIDGRFGGVRESLDDLTMAMAQNVARFLTENVRHSCGLPVECVIADTCIGGVSEAAKTADKFRREGVGVSLTVTPCWCYGSETIAATLRGNSYLAMGGVSMGIAGSIVNQDFFQEYLGMRNETVDMSEFIRRMDEEIYDPEEYRRALAWVRLNCPEGEDVNPPEAQRTREQKDRDWETCVKMAIIARDLMIGNPRLAELGFKEEAEGHNALASGFQGQRQWTDHFPNGDFLEAILCSSFDWNGIRQPFMVATENDSLNAVSMLFGHLLTGTAQLFSDVRTYWSPESVRRVTGETLSGAASGGLLHLINSGPTALDATGQMTRDGRPAMKPFWEIEPDEVARCLDNNHWCASVTEYFRGGGWSTDFVTRGGMPMTMCRINLVKGLGPVLQIAEGFSVDLPEKAARMLIDRTNPTWPTTWFVPNLTGQGSFKDVYSVMNNWGANHGAISFGHIGGDLISLAAILRIPVEMHNVPEERVFRPSAWARFGTMEPQGADYRACAAFGPLYR